MPKIAVVDENDQIIGAATESEIREKSLYCRLVRILVLNNNGQVLLQKRHPQASSSPGKWDYSAAGRVDEGEEYLPAAHRETYEEIGLSALELTELSYFYSEKIRDGKPVRRFNRVYLAKTDQLPSPNLTEIGGVEWFSPDEISKMIQADPDNFTSGLRTRYAEFKPLLVP